MIDADGLQFWSKTKLICCIFCLPPVQKTFRRQWTNSKFDLLYILDTCVFICQNTSTKSQRSDLLSFRVKLPPVYFLQDKRQQF